MIISLEDMHQQYLFNLFLYEGEYVYVAGIVDQNKVLIQVLATSKLKYVRFNPDDFKVVKKRLGYVNTGVFAIYLTRKSVRQYGLSLNHRNVTWIMRDEHFSESEHELIRVATQRINNVYMYKCLTESYPTFKEALVMVSQGKARHVAFDKQFAIDNSMVIYYKGCYVGKFKDGNIKLKKGYEHLQSVMGV